MSRGEKPLATGKILGILLVLLVWQFACATGPSSPSPAVAIAVNASAAFVLVGESVTLNARNQSTQEPMRVRWQNLTPDVAGLDGDVLTGLQHGNASLIALSGDSSAPLTVSVIANYNGWYPGRRADGETEVGVAYAIDCVASSPSYCAFNVMEEKLGKGPEPFAMRLSQIGNQVAGDVYIRCGNASVIGSVDNRGHLALSGAFGLKPPPTCPIEDWDTWLTDNGRALQGIFKYSSGLGSFRAIVTFQLRSLKRTP